MTIHTVPGLMMPISGLGVRCPASDDLGFGGVIGSVLVVNIVARHGSRWFYGPFALGARRPKAGAVHAGARSGGSLPRRFAMIRIAITAEALDAHGWLSKIAQPLDARNELHARFAVEALAYDDFRTISSRSRSPR